MARHVHLRHAHRPSRLHPRRILAALALVVVFVPATVSAASPNNWTTTKNLEYGNQSCGGHIEGAPFLGTVEYTRTGGQLAIRVQLGGEAADPNQDYVLSLWNTSPCFQIGGDIATITTDGSGDADETFTGLKLKGSKSFFVTLWNPTLEFYNNTPAVP